MRWPRPWTARLLARLWVGTVLLALLWPLAYAVWLSFTPGELLEPPAHLGDWSLRWYREFWGRPQWTAGLWTSLEVATLAALGALAGGVGLAVALTRYRAPDGTGRRWLSFLSFAVLLPLFVPGVVLGMALLPWMRALGLWGTRVSLAAAHALWSLPLVYLVVQSALADLDPDLEHAARSLGARPLTVFRRITLPVLAPALAVGGVIAFVLSLNEFFMALFLGTPAVETLPKVIWPELRYTLTPLVAAASGVTLLLTLVGLVVAARLVGLDGLLGERP